MRFFSYDIKSIWRNSRRVSMKTARTSPKRFALLTLPRLAFIDPRLSSRTLKSVGRAPSKLLFMNFTAIILTALLLIGSAHAGEVCHFTRAEIPRTEAQLMELARVVEFRCECVLPRLEE